MTSEKNKIISPLAIISLAIFIIIGAIHLATERSREFADLINATLSHSFRMFMASIGELFSFSLVELFILCLPLIVGFVIFLAVKKYDTTTLRIRLAVNLIAVILLVYSGHLLALGVGHNTTDVADKMGLSEVEVTEENLTETLIYLQNEINELADTLPRDERGVLTHGYSYSELSKGFSASYSELAEIYGLPSGYYTTAKGVYFSDVMSYLGIGGIYSYITGEANINTNYPDYVTTFTIAHELSHQRGIMRENEANFIAYILTSTSDSPAIRYSGALNMYNYFANALYKTDREAYFEITADLSDLARADLRAASEVSNKFGDTIFEEISDFINDFYLTSSGSGGIVSYSRVVELVLAYRYGNN